MNRVSEKTRYMQRSTITTKRRVLDFENLNKRRHLKVITRTVQKISFCHVSIILPSSSTVMQNMLDLCDVFSADLDVKFNTTKSVAMRIGPRYDAVCADLTLSGGIIQYVQSLKYLGVCIQESPAIAD